MVHDQLRALVRRYPIVRSATRRIRVHLPKRLGGLDPSRVPPRRRHLTLTLPRTESDTRGLGPDRVELRLPGDLTVPRRLAAQGLAWHEPDSLSCFMAILDHTGPGAVLDVGAGVGVYAMLAAARSRRPVFAFEPTPELAAAARSVSSSAHLGFSVVELALSNHNGTARLQRALHNDMCHQVVHNVRPGLHHLTVGATTLARWNETAGSLPTVVKIDTAGSEPEVVAGGLEILRRYRPWMLVKVRPDRGLEERLMALMEPLEYLWFPVAGDPPYEPRTQICGRASPSWERTWLFTPEEPPEAFWRSLREWRTALESCRGNPN